MAPVTTYMSQKPFAWSYSRLKNFEACPKKHFEVDLQKSVKEEYSEQLRWGDVVHKSMAERLGPKLVPLPASMQQYEKWAAPLLATPGDVYVEQQLALTKDFSACGYFDREVWFRMKGDFIKINGAVGLVLDWKTGKILEDSVQLALAAACVFAKYPDVQKIRSRFVWLKDDAKTDEDFTRGDMPSLWTVLWPRISALEQAYNTTTYPAVQGRLCRNWCPVTSCPYNGK